MSQQPGQYPEDDRRGQGNYGPEENYGRQYDHDAQQNHYGYDPNYPQGQQAQGQNYGQPYDGYGQAGYGYDSSYGHGQQAPGQNADPNYGGQGGNVYGEQNYAQYGGAPPAYGYDQGSDPNYGGQGYGGQGGNVYGEQQNYNYGGQQPGYPADPGARGYAPPAVQTGPRSLTASLHLDDGSNRAYQLIEGSNVVGRGQDAQFRLADTGVSRRHLEITWDSQVAMLADLGSTNGTTVNGTPVQTWQLVDGDVIRVGHSSLVFRAQG